MAIEFWQIATALLGFVALSEMWALFMTVPNGAIAPIGIACPSAPRSLFPSPPVFFTKIQLRTPQSPKATTEAPSNEEGAASTTGVRGVGDVFVLVSSALPTSALTRVQRMSLILGAVGVKSATVVTGNAEKGATDETVFQAVMSRIGETTAGGVSVVLRDNVDLAREFRQRLEEVVAASKAGGKAIVCIAAANMSDAKRHCFDGFVVHGREGVKSVRNIAKGNVADASGTGCVEDAMVVIPPLAWEIGAQSPKLRGSSVTGLLADEIWLNNKDIAESRFPVL